MQIKFKSYFLKKRFRKKQIAMNGQSSYRQSKAVSGIFPRI